MQASQHSTHRLRSSPAVPVHPPAATMSDVDVATAMAHKFTESTFAYAKRDTALYALSVGACDDPLNEKDLPLVYEMSGEGFRTIPTMAVLFATGGLAQIMSTPGLSFNPMMLLHGEQELRLNGALPVEGTITTKPKIGGIYDKVKGALVHLDATCHDESGKELASLRSSLFIRGIGGFGGDRGPKPEPWALPKRAPDARDEYKTTPNQALYYRLNGDTNPLHADPSMAAMGGFDRPILHGLCFFGIAGRVVLRDFCDNDVSKFKAIKARFAKSVYPGETVVTEMWNEGGRVVFQCLVKERGEVVLTNGVAEVEGLAASATGAGSAAASSGSSPTLKSAPMFDQIKEGVARDGAKLVKEVNGVIRFNVTPGGVWTVDLKNGSGSVTEGEGGAKPDLTLTVKDDDLVAIASGKLNAQQAFMKGAMKLKGNMALAMKLGKVLKSTGPSAKL